MHTTLPRSPILFILIVATLFLCIGGLANPIVVQAKDGCTVGQQGSFPNQRWCAEAGGPAR